MKKILDEPGRIAQDELSQEARDNAGLLLVGHAIAFLFVLLVRES